MKIQHKIFSDEIIKGSTPVEAYMVAYPKAKHESARVVSSKLLQNITVVNYLKERNAAIEAMANLSLASDLKQVKLSEVLTADRKKDLLRQIAEGTLITEQFSPTGEKDEDGKMGVTLVGVSFPTLLERMKAIELHNKMTGDNEPDKVSSTIDFSNVIEVTFT